MALLLRTINEKLKTKCEMEPVKGCLVWTGASCGHSMVKYGRMRARFPHEAQSKLYYTHRLAMMVYLQRFIAPDELLSHLCNMPLCCNPEHLSIEPAVVNNQRKHAFFQGKCVGNHSCYCTEYPDCLV